MMNGQKETLTIATSAESPDASRTAVAAADLEPLRLFEFLHPDGSPSLLPLDDIALKIRSSSDLKCSDYWMQILSHQPGALGELKFLL